MNQQKQQNLQGKRTFCLGARPLCAGLQQPLCTHPSDLRSWPRGCPGKQLPPLPEPSPIPSQSRAQEIASSLPVAAAFCNLPLGMSCVRRLFFFFFFSFAFLPWLFAFRVAGEAACGEQPRGGWSPSAAKGHEILCCVHAPSNGNWGSFVQRFKLQGEGKRHAHRCGGSLNAYKKFIK